MPFNIIRNDITKLDTDAIVNSANSNLLAGGGVCGTIFAAAGKEKLQKACKSIGYCATGEAVITKGYNLSAKYIIHTVAPVYGRDLRMEEKQLYSCYKNSLELAKKKRLSSIAFPLISSGIYGYPKAESLKIATRAIKDFLTLSDMYVYLVVYDRKSFAISEKLFGDVQSYIDKTLVIPEYRQELRDVDDIYEQSQYSAGFLDITKQSVYPEDELMMRSVKRNPRIPKLEAPMMMRPPRPLEELVKQEVETFSQVLLRFIDEKGMSDVEVYKRANIDRKLFSKIRGKNYTPRKHTIIALAIALRLNLDETKELLKRAGFAFSECNKFDVIIEYFLEQKQYDIFEINEALFYFEQPLLGV